MDFVLVDENPCPPGGRAGALTLRDGAQLRYGVWQVDPAKFAHPRGSVVVIQGRSEFIERYFEVIGELLNQGFCVATFDLRGQGLSTRKLPDRRRGHIDHFKTYDDDLKQFMEEIVATEMPLPWLGLGHSLGGNILLRAVHDNIDWFTGALFTAPMLGLRLGSNVAQRSVRLLTASMARLGLGSSYVLGGGPSGPIEVDFADNILTSDPVRYERMQCVLRVEPNLMIGAPTMGWLHASLQAIDEVAREDYLTAIKVPAMIFLAEEDALITGTSIRHAALEMAHAELVSIPGARHEILIEQDIHRRRFWAGFSRFADRLLGQALG